MKIDENEFSSNSGKRFTRILMRSRRNLPSMPTRGALSLCVVACRNDEDLLLKSHVIAPASREGTGEDFDISELIATQYVRDARLHATQFQVQAFYYGNQGEAVEDTPGLMRALDSRPSGLVVIVGPYARGSSSLTKIIDYVQDLNDQDDTTEFLVVGFADAKQVVAHIGRSTSPIVPQKSSPRDSYDGRWHTALCQELAGALKEIEENQSPEPNVGVGGLLLDSTGRFFLARRHAGVGRGKYVTFGGILPRGISVSDALAKYASEQLRLPPQVFSFGDMLSCSNMRRGRNHFVDLTFLSLTQNPNVGVDARRHGPIDPKAALDSSESYWWSFREMVRHYESGKLFRPVANAFERYCLWALNRLLTSEFPMLHGSWRDPRHGSTFDLLPAIPLKELVGYAARVQCHEQSAHYFESDL